MKSQQGPECQLRKRTKALVDSLPIESMRSMIDSFRRRSHDSIASGKGGKQS